jgi:hypothetical protein
VVRLRASTRRVMTPSALARAETVGCRMEPALRFAPQPWAKAVSRWLLGGYAPARLFARLFTSSLNSASARPLTAASATGRPYGPARGPPNPVSPDPSGRCLCRPVPVRPRRRNSQFGYSVCSNMRRYPRRPNRVSIRQSVDFAAQLPALNEVIGLRVVSVHGCPVGLG